MSGTEENARDRHRIPGRRLPVRAILVAGIALLVLLSCVARFSGTLADGAPQASTARGDAQGTAASAATTKPFQHPAGLMKSHGVVAPAAYGAATVPLEPNPEGVLLISGNTQGWITPCGCPGSQAGGLSRRAGFAELLRKTFPGIWVGFADQGGVMALEGVGQRETSTAAIESLGTLGYRAINVTAADLGTTREAARWIDDAFHTPRISANVVFDDSQQLAFRPYAILEVPIRRSSASPDRSSKEAAPPIRVALLGVTDDEQMFAFGPGDRSLVTTPIEAALARYVPEAKAKADLVILLADAGVGVLKTILSRVKGIDLVLGGTPTDFQKDPLLADGVPIFALGSQGKYLAEVRLFRKDGRATLAPTLHWLDEMMPEDEALAKFAEGVLDHVNALNRTEIASTPVLGPDGIAPYVGAPQCKSCHASDYEIWSGSRHARAIETLKRLNREYTMTCVPCHVTGTNAYDGTFRDVHATPQLVNVQCEQCHGPGAAHLEDPSRPYGIVADNTCILCHTPATDPTFVRAERWPRIVHGGKEPR